jgi:hypothetical protein
LMESLMLNLFITFCVCLCRLDRSCWLWWHTYSNIAFISRNKEASIDRSFRGFFIEKMHKFLVIISYFENKLYGSPIDYISCSISLIDYQHSFSRICYLLMLSSLFAFAFAISPPTQDKYMCKIFPFF